MPINAGGIGHFRDWFGWFYSVLGANPEKLGLGLALNPFYGVGFNTQAKGAMG